MCFWFDILFFCVSKIGLRSVTTQFEAVLAALQASGKTNNTIVFLASDNGYVPHDDLPCFV
jgi:arylsulfatase A-like enzyme